MQSKMTFPYGYTQQIYKYTRNKVKTFSLVHLNKEQGTIVKSESVKFKIKLSYCHR